MADHDTAMDLAAIPWRTTRQPGIAVHFHCSDERSGRVVALIRMEPGRGYPPHRHRGPEHVLVLQGGYRDERGRHTAGTFVHYADGTTHTPVALDDPHMPPCVLLTVAHEGIDLLR